MIDYENRPGQYRGPIEVLLGKPKVLSSGHISCQDPEWFWRTKGKNGQVTGTGGEGYKKRQGCVNAVDRLFTTKLTGISVGLDLSGPDPITGIVTPWRLVVFDRDGSVNREGALY